MMAWRRCCCTFWRFCRGACVVAIRKTKCFCARLLGVYPALWTFVVVEGVEPTNNHVERAQRRAVLWRRRSFGCQSAAGCRFVERILTVVQTLRLQERSVLQFLNEIGLASRDQH